MVRNILPPGELMKTGKVFEISGRMLVAAVDSMASAAIIKANDAMNVAVTLA